MVLSRFLVQNQLSNQCTFRSSVAICSVRSSSQVALRDEGEGNVSAKDAPNFFQKISMRLKGIPLKGEDHAPTSWWFQDIDKVFHPPQPLPSVPKDYKEFPERDLVNYPYPEKDMFPPKTRMLMFPDSWLSPFHKVTGTSGPYVFLGTVTAFLLNKEFLPSDENFMKLSVFLLIYYVITRSFEYKVDSFWYKKSMEKIADLKKFMNEELKDAVEFRKTSAAEGESLKAMQENFPTIFKENLALQLEATYRRNVDTVANELKRRLDYLQEVEDTKTRFERDILLKSVILAVENQISKNEGNIKEAYLDNCINQLKTLQA